jgi:hypothetical protein
VAPSLHDFATVLSRLTSFPVSLSVDALVGYASTWSAYSIYRRRWPQRPDPLIEYRARLVAALEHAVSALWRLAVCVRVCVRWAVLTCVHACVRCLTPLACGATLLPTAGPVCCRGCGGGAHTRRDGAGAAPAAAGCVAGQHRRASLIGPAPAAD